MRVFILSLFFTIFQVVFAAEFKDALTNDELEWLHKHPIIKHTGNPNYLPYEAFDKYGNHDGMVADYLDIIEKKLKIKIQRVPSLSWSDAVAKGTSMQVDMLSDYTCDKDFLNTHVLSINYFQDKL